MKFFGFWTELAVDLALCLEADAAVSHGARALRKLRRALWSTGRGRVIDRFVSAMRVTVSQSDFGWTLR